MIEHYTNLYYVAGVSIACNICLLFIAGAMGWLLLKKSQIRMSDIQMNNSIPLDWNKLRAVK